MAVWIGYDRQRVATLRTRAADALRLLQTISSDDPAAASAMQVVRSAQLAFEERLMPLLDRVLRSEAMLTWASSGTMEPMAWRSAPAERPLTDEEVVTELDAAVDAVLDDGATDAEWERLASVLAEMAGRAGQATFVRWLREEHGPNVFDRLVLALDKSDRRAGVEPPPQYVLQSAATLMARASKHDGGLRARIGELDEDFAVVGRLRELADIDTDMSAQPSSYEEMMSAIDAAGLGADFVEEATKKFNQTKLQVVAVVVEYEEVFVITDGETTGVLSTNGRGALAYVDAVPSSLTKFAGELGRVANVGGNALDAWTIGQAAVAGWQASEREDVPGRVGDAVDAALPEAAEAATDWAVFSGGAAVCSLFPALALFSPICGVGAVVGTKVGADVLDNEGAEPSYCDGGVFDAEEADSMGFDHTTEEVLGCD